MQQSVRNVCAKVWSWSFQLFSYWSTSSVYNLNIKFSLNTFSNQITTCKISFEFYMFVVKQINAWKVDIWVPLAYFLFILFFCWNGIKKKSSIKESRREMDAEKRFLQKLLEIVVIMQRDHYAISIYIKVFLKLASLWI